MSAAEELHQFWSQNGGLLTVGLPIGPVTRDANGSYHLPCEAGSLLKVDDFSRAQDGTRLAIDSIDIVGCRCFASDDPAGDETYLVANFGWFGFDENSKEVVPQLMTTRTTIPDDNTVKGDDNDTGTPGSVILTNQRLTPASIQSGQLIGHIAH